MSNSHNHLNQLHLLVESHLDQVGFFCEEWTFQPHIKLTFRDWLKEAMVGVEEVVSENNSNMNKWQLLFGLLIFQQVRKQLIHLGFYSFRKQEVENLLLSFMQTFSSDTFKSIENDEELSSILKRSEQDFPLLKQRERLECTTTDQMTWLKQWLTRPHFSKYVQYYTALSVPNQQLQLKKEVINQLFPLQNHTPTRRTFFQIIDYHLDYDEGIRAWLYFPQDPLLFTREEQSLFKKICEHRVDLAVPLYMQWIERLIEKKSSAHYKKAHIYLKELQKMSERTNDQNRFEQYLAMIRKKYRKYSAFYEGLKQVEA
ncbi:hypothetical protein [Salipaludibacillus keqinensis]|nr:hypothetical protein [Salipaludibacillus keqinensis]